MPIGAILGFKLCLNAAFFQDNKTKLGESKETHCIASPKVRGMKLGCFERTSRDSLLLLYWEVCTVSKELAKLASHIAYVVL